MDNIGELKEIDIENSTCYYFNDIIKIEDFNLDNSLIDEKAYKNILFYNISYKTIIDAKPLRIRFDKVEGFIRVYDRSRYLVLFWSEKCDFIYNRIRYLTSVKGCITYVVCHKYAKIKVDSYHFLPLEKAMTFHKVILLIKSVFNKDENNFYCNICLEKAMYELPKK